MRQGCAKPILMKTKYKPVDETWWETMWFIILLLGSRSMWVGAGLCIARQYVVAMVGLLCGAVLTETWLRLMEYEKQREEDEGYE
jgi:hypothetical protein